MSCEQLALRTFEGLPSQTDGFSARSMSWPRPSAGQPSVPAEGGGWQIHQTW